MNSRSLRTWIVSLSLVTAAGCSTLRFQQRPIEANSAHATRDADGVSAVLPSTGAIDKADTTATIVPTSFTAPQTPASPTLADTCTTVERATASGLSQCLNFRDDCDRLANEFFSDFESVFSHDNVLILLAAGGASFAIHETLDDDVAENVIEHKNRWGKGQEFFAGIGNPGHHFAAIAGLYLYSLHAQDVETHELSRALFNAVSITGLSTMFLKATIGTNTEAPNGEPDPFGGAWPSGHTSSSFAFAAVLDEYCGPKIGIPAYLLAGLVGWERLDDGEHDLSDVIFGAVLGYVIGKTVSGEHQARCCGFEIQANVDPVTGTTGICLERRF